MYDLYDYCEPYANIVIDSNDIATLKPEWSLERCALWLQAYKYEVADAMKIQKREILVDMLHVCDKY
jgi:hypothetical protein